MALDGRFFAKVRRDSADLDSLGADEAGARPLVPVDAAEPRAEVALAQVRIGGGALLGFLGGAQELVARRVVLKEEGRGEMELASGE